MNMGEKLMSEEELRNSWYSFFMNVDWKEIKENLSQLNEEVTSQDE